MKAHFAMYRQLLLAAVEARDLGVCVDLIYAAGWSTPARVADLSAALRKAAEVGAPRICKVLVAVGAGVNHGDHTERTPLHHAAWKGHTGAVAVLLDAPRIVPN